VPLAECKETQSLNLTTPERLRKQTANCATAQCLNGDLMPGEDANQPRNPDQNITHFRGETAVKVGPSSSVRYLAALFVKI
jgi:hypothetical protein